MGLNPSANYMDPRTYLFLSQMMSGYNPLTPYNNPYSMPPNMHLGGAYGMPPMPPFQNTGPQRSVLPDDQQSIQSYHFENFDNRSEYNVGGAGGGTGGAGRLNMQYRATSIAGDLAPHTLKIEKQNPVNSTLLIQNNNNNNAGLLMPETTSNITCKSISF